MSLFWRIFLVNALVLLAATALLLGPVTVSTPVLLTEAAIIATGLAASVEVKPVANDPTTGHVHPDDACCSQLLVEIDGYRASFLDLDRAVGDGRCQTARCPSWPS